MTAFTYKSLIGVAAFLQKESRVRGWRPEEVLVRRYSGESLDGMRPKGITLRVEGSGSSQKMIVGLRSAEGSAEGMGEIETVADFSRVLQQHGSDTNVVPFRALTAPLFQEIDETLQRIERVGSIEISMQHKQAVLDFFGFAQRMRLAFSDSDARMADHQRRDEAHKARDQRRMDSAHILVAIGGPSAIALMLWTMFG
jgi:hypothetical protein